MGKFVHIIVVISILIVTIVGISGPGKYGKYSGNRGTASDTTGTDSIIVVVGSGAGVNEEILGETFVFRSDSASDYYSVYNGFLGITFTQDSGKVFQSRYTNQTYSVDGDLTVLMPMTYLYEIDEIRMALGILSADSVGLAGSDTTAGPAEVDISQYSYIRPDTSDQFFILEYYFNNTDTVFDLTGGKALFFCDIDVGDGIYDNLTGIDSSRNLIYQYSTGDDFCGMAQIYPENMPVYGNYDAWYYGGTNALVDSVVVNPEYNELYETITDDYSVYLLTDIGDLPAEGEKKAAYAFALGRNLTDLQLQIDAAHDLYYSVNAVEPRPVPQAYDLFSVYPNPFNSQLSVELKLSRAGEGTVRIYDILGRQVYQVYQGYLATGSHCFGWNGETGGGVKTAAGIYILRADFPSYHSTQKIVYLP